MATTSTTSTTSSSPTVVTSTASITPTVNTIRRTRSSSGVAVNSTYMKVTISPKVSPEKLFYSPPAAVPNVEPVDETDAGIESKNRIDSSSSDTFYDPLASPEKQSLPSADLLAAVPATVLVTGLNDLTADEAKVGVDLDGRSTSNSSEKTVYDVSSLWETVNEQQKLIAELAKLIDERSSLILNNDKRINRLQGELTLLRSQVAIKDSVTKGLQNEIARLQQYTRRYSLTIAGIPKPPNEKPENLRKIVEEIIDETDSTVTAVDIDKLHRNGPYKDGNQDVIVRLKSHSAKEAVYKARKSLPAAKKEIKIRPSLGPFQKRLLQEAKETVDEISQHSNLINPPHFVLADVHGNLQVKFKEKTTKQRKRNGMFVPFNSIDQLTRIIAQEQTVDVTDDLYQFDQEWADLDVDYSDRRGNYRISEGGDWSDY